MRPEDRAPYIPDQGGRTRCWLKVKQPEWTLSEDRWQQRITAASP